MSFYGNVTYYMSNAFGKMVFRNYSTLAPDNSRLEVGQQKNGQANSASFLSGNRMTYDMGYSPSNKKDSLVIATGNRWITFAKYQGNDLNEKEALGGDNTIILYHTLPTEFIQPNPGEDGAYIGEEPENILDNLNTEYYKVKNVLGRNYSQNPDQNEVNREDNMRINWEKELAVGTDGADPRYSPLIPYSDWGDIIAIPQLVYDEAGHIVYAENNYIRLQEAPQIEIELNQVKRGLAGILQVVYGSIYEGNEEGIENAENSLLTAYQTGITASNSSYYNNQPYRNDKVNMMDRLNHHESLLNDAYLSNGSAINKLRLKLGTWGQDNSGNMFEITSDVVSENDGRDPNSIMKQLNTVQNQQTTLNTANAAIVDRINALIDYLNGVAGSSIPEKITNL